MTPACRQKTALRRVRHSRFREKSLPQQTEACMLRRGSLPESCFRMGFAHTGHALKKDVFTAADPIASRKFSRAFLLRRSIFVKSKFSKDAGVGKRAIVSSIPCRCASSCGFSGLNLPDAVRNNLLGQKPPLRRQANQGAGADSNAALLQLLKVPHHGRRWMRTHLDFHKLQRGSPRIYSSGWIAVFASALNKHLRF